MTHLLINRNDIIHLINDYIKYSFSIIKKKEKKFYKFCIN